MKKPSHLTLILILGALTALAPFSVDMYLPGFPGIAKDFHISTARVTLSLSSFFLGISLGQVIYGPLIDRFGRKKPLYFGLFLYLIASAGCYFAPSIEVLIGLRFVQAIGSCAAGVVSIAMVRDLFPIEDNAKIFSLLLLVLGASPMVAPTIGGFISAAFGWQAIFVVLFFIALFIFITVYAVLPETHQPDKTYSLKPGPIILGFWQVITEPQFFTYAIGGGIALSGLFAYVSDSPTIFMIGYHVSNGAFGWIFAFLAIGFIGTSQFNQIFARYFKPDQIVIGALTCMVIVSAILLFGLEHGWFGMIATAIFIFICLGCIGILNPNTAALSMAPFEKNAGSAASLFGLVQWGIAGLSSIAISLFKSDTPIPLAEIMTGTAVLSLAIIVIGRKTIKHRVVMPDGKLQVV
ncbi:MAG: multidrug effflux MFS transporter [Bacteroidota bacterium]|nr:multidrug effflux MFS transporter [Bacteroidota bacterium]